MWKKIVCFTMIMVYLMMNNNITYSVQPDGQVSMDLVILVDRSGTMDKYAEETKAWAKVICEFAVMMPLKVSLITFDGQCVEQFKDMSLSVENCQAAMSTIEDITFEGALTNHQIAIEKAESILSNSSADIKYIVMISDGTLDLIGRLKGDTTPLTPDEKEAINNFGLVCKQLAKRNDYFIDLIGMGGDVPLFKSLVSECRTEKIENIDYIEKTEDMKLTSYFGSDGIENKASNSGLTEKILNKMGLSFTDIKPVIINNQIQFDLDQDYYKCVINIANKELDDAELGQVTPQLIHNQNIKNTLENPIICGSMFYYLDQPKKGTYQIINLPETGDWKCSIMSIANVNVKDVKVSLLEGDQEAKPLLQDEEHNSDYKEYELEKYQKGISIKIQPISDNSDNNQLSSISELYYCICEEEDTENCSIENWETWKNKAKEIKEFAYNEKIGAWVQSINIKELVPDKKYICWLKLDFGEKIINKQFSFVTNTAPPTPTPTPKVILVEVNQKILLKDYLTDKSLIENTLVEFLMDDKEINAEDEYEQFSFSEDGELIFYETGEYTMCVKNLGLEAEIIKFNVKLSLNDKIVIGVGIVVAVAVAVVSVIVGTCKKKKNK